jgi:erythromycin esterase
MKYIMLFWTWRTEEVKELLIWMREYNEDKPDEDKIHFIGVDCQSFMHQADVMLNYFNETDIWLSEDSLTFLNKVIELKNHNLIQRFFYYRFMTEDKKTKFNNNVDQLISEIEDLKDEFIAASSEYEYLFIKRIALNIKQTHEFQCAFYGKSGSQINLRDLYMAKNTLWTSDLFGGNTKVVLWAHNMHVANYSAYGSIGFHLREELKDDYQIVGFSFSKGSFTAIAPFGILRKLKIHQIILAPRTDSINYYFHHAKYENFLLKISEIQENSELDIYLSQPQSFLTIGALFGRLLHLLGGYYMSIYLKTLFDFVINWDTTQAAEQLN